MLLLSKFFHPGTAYTSGEGNLTSFLHASLKQVAACVIFALAMTVSYFISISMEAIDNTTSWFLPAGVRVYAFLLLDKRFWPALLVGEFTLFGMSVDYIHHGSAVVSVAGMVDYLTDPLRVIPPLGAMLGVAYLRRKKANQNAIEVKWWLMAIMVCITFIQGVLRALTHAADGALSLLQTAELTIGYWIGDLIGCFLVLSVVLIVSQSRGLRLLQKGIVLALLIGGLVALCELFVWLTGASNPFYLFKLLTLLALPICIYYYNLQGAMLVLLGVCISLVLLKPQAVVFWELQVFVLSLAISGFLTGSAFELVKEKTNKLRESVMTLEKNNREIKRLTKQLATATDKERERLAQELHDDVGQSIIGLKTEVKLGERLGLPDAFLQSLRSQIDYIYTSVYEILFQLRPKELEDVGLAGILTGEKFYLLLNKNGITYMPDVHLQHTPDKAVEADLFRIAQEAISNVIKHSGASRCAVQFKETDTHWRLVIKDNGRGFDPAVCKAGHGLQSMRDRSAQHNAELTIERRNGWTQVQLCVEKNLITD